MPVFYYKLSMEMKRFYIFKMSGFFFVMTGRFKCKCLTKIKSFEFVDFTRVVIVLLHIKTCSYAHSALDVIAAQLTTDVKAIHFTNML